MLEENFSIVMSFICLSASLFVLSLWKFMQISCGIAPICPPTPVDQLREMLGAAYNARYMSIDKPADLFTFTPEFTDVNNRQNSSSDAWKRLPNEDGRRHLMTVESNDFHVAPSYRRLLQDEKNNKELIKHAVSGSKFKRHLRQRRLKRSATTTSKRQRRQASPSASSKFLPWQCSQHIEWLDLGQDHFPRYVRSVKCTSDRCFYGHYQCKPKAFTVKVLRRISDKCVELTAELRQKLSLPVISDSTSFDGQNIDNLNDQPRFFEPWVFEEIAVNFCCDCVV